jgi:hypothetical protein
MQTEPVNERTSDRIASTIKLLLIAATTIVIVGGSAVWNDAIAQNNPDRAAKVRPDPNPPANEQARFQAPVGHRQPRPADLPSSTLRDEKTAPPGETAIDKDLQICRGC